MEKHVTEENVQMANKSVIRCSRSPAIQDLQRDITTHLLVQLIISYKQTTYLLVQLIISYKQTTSNTGEDTEKRSHLYIVGRNIKWYRPSGQSFGH